MRETWKSIQRYKGRYKVSNLGRVKSLGRWARNRNGWCFKKERILKPCPSRTSGHLHVNLCKHGKGKLFTIHSLVLEAFVGPRPEGMEVRHFPDRDPTNNRLNNLSWSDRTTNQRDRVFHGTDERGEKSPNAKLTDKKVLKAKRLRIKGWTYRQIKQEIKTNASTWAIRAAVVGVQWKHLI